MKTTTITITHEDDDALEDALFYLADTLTEGNDLPLTAGEGEWRIKVKMMEDE